MKQQRPPERTEAPREVRESAPDHDVDASVVDQGLLGNAALQSLEGAREPAPADLDVVRDVARPMVDHAALVLQIPPTEPARLARLVEIVEQSRLPDDRRQDILDRLRTNDVTASRVHDAVRAAFGDDSPALRAALSDLLDAVHGALGEGRPSGDAWALADRAVPLSAETRDGGVTARAGALVRDLAQHAGAVPAEGVRAFCLAVHLALTLDEDEEDELFDGAAPALDA